MTDNAAPQGDGALTVDQAVSLLTAEPQTEQPEKQAQEAAPEPEAEDTEGETSAPEEVEETDENPPETEETEAPETEAVEPLEAPRYWSQEAKAKFAQLPPELQAVVLSQEGPREEAAAKAKAEAAEIRKQADEEVKGVRTLAEKLGEFVPKAVDTFKTRWDDIDWQGWANRILSEPDAEAANRDQAAYNAARLEFEAQKAQVEQLAQAQAHAQALAEAQYIREQSEALKVEAPELAKSPETMKTVASYLVNRGVPVESLKTLSAVEASIAYESYLYRQAKAKAQAAVVSKPKAPPVKSVASVATAAPVSSQQRQAQTAKNRFAQTRSVEDAVALLMSKGI